MTDKKTKKILIFSLAYYPRFIGGAEIAIKKITDRISPEDIEFHMVTLRFDSLLSKTEKIGNIIVHRIGFTTPTPDIADLKYFPLILNKYWYQCGAFLRALWLHRKHRFDGVWAMMAHSCGIPAGLFKTFRPRVKYLLTLQEGDVLEDIELLARPVWPLFKRGFTKADALQTISTFLLAWGRRMGFAGHAEVIPNGVDVAGFTQSLSEDVLESVRRKIGKREGETWLIHTGRLVRKNGLDTVIRSLSLLPESVHFFMLGDGLDGDSLAALAHDAGVSSRVHFHPYVPVEDIPKYLKVCEIFIRPSRSEGMGNSFIEAMAAGLPVIATQVGGIADFLFDAKRNPDKETTGWAVDIDSLEQIARAVETIMADIEQVKRVTTTAKKLVSEKYGWDHISRDMRNLFDRLLENR